MTESKKWYQSKTLWLNVLVIVGGVVEGLNADITAGVTLTAIGVVNIILRAITKSGIQL